MESRRLVQHSISMAIQQLAKVIHMSDAEIGNCPLEQIRVNLNVISDIISNVAQYVRNHPNNETFDSTVRAIYHCFDPFVYYVIYIIICEQYYWSAHSRLSMGLH